MDITLKANTHASPYFSLGKGMIVYGILGILSTALNFTARWWIYENDYIYHFSPSYNGVSYYMILLFGQLVIAVAEVILVVIFYKTANNTHIHVFRQIAIIHLVYIIYLIGYQFLLPRVLDIFNLSTIESLVIVYSIAGFGLVVILILGDWFLYQLCLKLLRLHPIRMTLIIYFPFFLMGFRLINFLTGIFASNVILPVFFTGFAIVIPIFWILIGNNFKLIAPLSENTAGYTAGEPRLDYYTPQGGEGGIDYTPQNMTSTAHAYGICSQCGNPRLSSADIFCSNCGNRF